jgi:hypothetical protein
METNLLDKMLTAQDEFLAELDKKAEALRTSQTPSDDALKEKDELLGSERQRLENLKGTRQQAVARFDTEIKRQTELIESLEKEIEGDRKTLATAEAGPAPGKHKVTAAKGSKGKKSKRKKASKGSA